MNKEPVRLKDSIGLFCAGAGGKMSPPTAKAKETHAGPEELTAALVKVAPTISLLLVVAPLTIGAIGAFPMFDDAWSWLYLREQGSDFVRGVPDRPVMAYLWTLLASSEETFRRMVFAAHAILWFSLSMISGFLWRQLFPDLRSYAWVVACATVAPFGFNVQMVLHNVVLGSLLSVVLAYVGLLCVFRYVRRDDSLGWIWLGIGQFLMVCSIVFIEYALSVVIVMIVILLFDAYLVSNIESRHRAYRAIALSTLVSCAGYALFVVLADWNANAEAYPAHSNIMRKPDLMMLAKFSQSIWQGLGGNFISSLLDISLLSWTGVGGAIYGALVGGLLFYCSRGEQPSQSVLSSVSKGRGLMLLVAFVAALIPPFLVGRFPWNPEDGMTARFGIPVLPIGAALIVLISMRLVRKRFWPIPILLLGFAAGHAAFTQAWGAIQERNEMAALGGALQQYVSPKGGYTVAVLPSSKRRSGPPRQWELTARLAATWPRELVKKFWAFRYGGNTALPYPEEASSIFGPRGACKLPLNIDYGVRLIRRQGPLDHLLWVERLPDGSVSVEPYCNRTPSTPAQRAN